MAAVDRLLDLLCAQHLALETADPATTPSFSSLPEQCFTRASEVRQVCLDMQYQQLHVQSAMHRACYACSRHDWLLQPPSADAVSSALPDTSVIQCTSCGLCDRVPGGEAGVATRLDVRIPSGPQFRHLQTLRDVYIEARRPTWEPGAYPGHDDMLDPSFYSSAGVIGAPEIGVPGACGPLPSCVPVRVAMMRRWPGQPSRGVPRERILSDYVDESRESLSLLDELRALLTQQHEQLTGVMHGTVAIERGVPMPCIGQVQQIRDICGRISRQQQYLQLAMHTLCQECTNHNWELVAPQHPDAPEPLNGLNYIQCHDCGDVECEFGGVDAIAVRMDIRIPDGPQFDVFRTARAQLLARANPPRAPRHHHEPAPAPADSEGPSYSRVGMMRVAPAFLPPMAAPVSPISKRLHSGQHHAGIQ